MNKKTSATTLPESQAKPDDATAKPRKSAKANPVFNWLYSLADDRIEPIDEQTAEAPIVEPHGSAQTNDAELLPIPGQDILGRGVTYYPGDCFSFKRHMITRRKPGSKAAKAKKIFNYTVMDRNYWHWNGVAVDSSPPLPSDAYLNRTLVEENYESMRRATNYNMNANLESSLFIDVSESRQQQISSAANHYVGQKDLFVPLWSLFLPQIQLNLNMIEELLSYIPESFEKFQPDGSNLQSMNDQKKRFDYIFQRFGTHFIKRVWVGGKANVVMKISKSEVSSISEVYSSLRLVFTEQQLADHQRSSQLLNKSSLEVWGEGGDITMLGRLTQMDDNGFADWMESVNKAPDTSGVEVDGLWMLLLDLAQIIETAMASGKMLEAGLQAHLDASNLSPSMLRKKASNLQKGFRYKTEYRAITFAAIYNSQVLLFREGLFLQIPLPAYLLPDDPDNPVQLQDLGRPGLSMISFFKETMQSFFPFNDILPLKADLSLWGVPFKEGIEPRAEGNYWFIFRDRDFLVADALTGEPLTDLLPIQGINAAGQPYWPGFPLERIDACFVADEERAYFFYGDQYCRYERKQHYVTSDYPKRISENWIGVPYTRISSVLKILDWLYIFANGSLLIYDLVSYKALPNYPKVLRGVYFEDWNIPLPIKY